MIELVTRCAGAPTGIFPPLVNLSFYRKICLLRQVNYLSDEKNAKRDKLSRIDVERIRNPLMGELAERAFEGETNESLRIFTRRPSNIIKEVES